MSRPTWWWCWKTQSMALKNTECNYVMRWCGPSPAVFVFNPLWRGLLPIILTVPSDRPNNMGKWQYPAHLDHPVGGCRNEERNAHARLDQTMVVGKNNGISWIDDYVMNPPRPLDCRNELLDPVRRKIWQTRNFLWRHRNYLHAQTPYVYAIMTPYASCNRVTCILLIQHTVSTDMYHNSATQVTVVTVYVSNETWGDRGGWWDGQ